MMAKLHHSTTLRNFIIMMLKKLLLVYYHFLGVHLLIISTYSANVTHGLLYTISLTQ